jgi:hypothetical protein
MNLATGPRRLLTPHAIMGLTGALLAAGLAVWLWWLYTDDVTPLLTYFLIPGAGFLVFAAVAETSLAARAMRAFGAGEPMRSVWSLIAVGGGFKIAGAVLAHVLASPSPMNPLWGSQSEAREAVRFLGLLLGGAVPLLFLTVALTRVLRLYLKLGFRPSLKVIDMLAIVGGVSQTLWAVSVAQRLVESGGAPPYWTAKLNWSSDPILCVLLVESLLLLRLVQQMGGGLIARCWTCYVLAVILTLIGDFSLWLEVAQFIPWQLLSPFWFFWFPAAACFALGPAYQVQAIQVAEAAGEPAAPELRS